jgi:hypothetical protein
MRALHLPVFPVNPYCKTSEMIQLREDPAVDWLYAETTAFAEMAAHGAPRHSATPLISAVTSRPERDCLRDLNFDFGALKPAIAKKEAYNRPILGRLRALKYGITSENFLDYPCLGCQ